MLRKILTHGLAAGLISGLAMGVLTTVPHGHLPMAVEMALGYATMLVALSTVFLAVKRHRDTALGGVIRFWPALFLGLGISVVGGVIYALAWEVTQALNHMDYVNDYAQAMISQQKASGASDEALAALTVEMDKMRAKYANPLYRLSLTFNEIFPVGVLVSLVSAGLLRNSRFWPARRAPVLA
ncbi:DUF4199 domain-containing protein [Nitrospirillum iridis]|uniref:DUF4199 domain-containing protein n=1 Tax=Nitrospirillum iridis TaxID=765888 RepID=A0A7X0EH37_9PROT|nr:DUF4199 domain-containing protein [Nitrospirillum iridis]MBB6254219.1 hypothetical protein [Nitrospirillum iridis]